MKRKMITCKTCGADVASSAKTCPHCGAKLKKPKALGIVLIVVVVIAIIGAVSGGNGPQKVDPNNPDASTAQPDKTQTEFAVGDTAALNNVEVAFVSCTETTGTDFFTPQDGYVFLLCEFEINNKSESEIAVSSLASFTSYVDDYATQLSLTATTSSDTPQLDGKVAPGKKMSGVVGYEVPADWKELDIRFTPNFWSGKDITFIANAG